MGEDEEYATLEQLIDKLQEAPVEDDRISLDGILDEIGHRSFGPILLIAALITVMPVVGDIPGVPTMVGVFVLLVAVQLFMGRNYFWLPKWLLKRSISKDKFHKALAWMRRPARWVDRLMRPRLSRFTEGTGVYIIAAACIVIAAAMPAMELVPFSANGAGVALLAFGLALIAGDGLLAVIALAFTAGTVGLVAYSLL